jgi:hypothetical protein
MELERGERIALRLFKIGGVAVVLALLCWLIAIWTPGEVSGDLGLTGLLFIIPGLLTMVFSAISLEWIQ